MATLEKGHTSEFYTVTYSGPVEFAIDVVAWTKNGFHFALNDRYGGKPSESLSIMYSRTVSVRGWPEDVVAAQAKGIERGTPSL